MFAPYGRKRRGADARMGTKRIARRQKKSKKNKNKNPGGLRTEDDSEISPDYAEDIEYQSCDMKEYVDFKIREFKDFLLQKYNQVSWLRLGCLANSLVTPPTDLESYRFFLVCC